MHTVSLMANPAPIRDSKADAAKRKRERRAAHQDKAYLAWAATQPCIVTGRFGVELHHQPRKSQADWHDRKVVPLVPELHRGLMGVHMLGVEQFEKIHEVDMASEIERLNKLYEGETK